MYEQAPMEITQVTKWRLVEIDSTLIVKEFGLWQLLWGTDIFINGVPLLKIIVLANIIVWLVTT